MSFASETEAFRELQQLLGEGTVHLLDTYDTIQGAKNVAALGKPLWGVRIDSGDFFDLSRKVRGILDDAGLTEAKIMASGDLEENRIAALVADGAPIDAFGVGTELAVSGDAPSMGAIYKLVEIDSGGTVRTTAKQSPEKSTLAGAKQLFRLPDHDVLALHDECIGGADAILKPYILGGRLVQTMPDAEKIRARAKAAMTPWPIAGRRTELSPRLQQINASVL
jgi:nicotinate phosphoribosyltransferase